MNFGLTSLAAPQAASSNVSRYSLTERRVAAIASQSTSSDPSTERCLFASALIRLASTAKPSPPTSPSAMQRRTVVSNTLRSRSLSRKRPCRFFEKVEWSGTAPSSPRRQRWSRRATTPGRVSPDVCPQTFQGGDHGLFRRPRRVSRNRQHLHRQRCRRHPSGEKDRGGASGDHRIAEAFWPPV